MFKKITWNDIEFYSYGKNPYEILQAESSSNYISLYINKTQRITVFQKGNHIYEYEFEEEIDENKNENEKIECNTKAQKFKKLTKTIIDYFLNFILILLLTPILFKLLVYTSLSKEMNITFSLFLAIILTCIYNLMIEFILCCIIAKNNSTSKTKSNHSAEHMIINFISKNYRLPNNIEELRHASRFDQCCGSYRYLHQDFLTHIATTFVISMLMMILIILDLPIIFNTFIWLIFGFIKDKLCKPIIQFLTTIGSYIIQYKASTTKNVSDESLIAAYIAANIWFIITHDNEYDENIYYTFLQPFDVIDIHKCDTKNQP